MLACRLAAPHSALALVAIVFIISGLCFRVAAVPLQFYAPDVYQGSPTVIAALFAWVPKAVGFLAMIKTLTAVFSAREVTNPLVQKAIIITWIIAAATMIWGNVLALLQNNLKRLMAYSSIAHAGYLMVGITASFANDGGTGGIYYGSESVLFYLVVYALMTVGTFGGFMLLRLGGRELETVEELDGLGWVHPWPALGLSICLLSLSGIPPLAGFMGKLEIFAAAIAARERVETSGFLLLAVIGMLTSAIGAYYYLRIVVVMYLRPSRQPVELSGGWPVALPVAACAGLSLLLGVFSGPLVHGARSAAESALARPDPGVIRTADSIQFPPTAALSRAACVVVLNAEFPLCFVRHCLTVPENSGRGLARKILRRSPGTIVELGSQSAPGLKWGANTSRQFKRVAPSGVAVHDLRSRPSRSGSRR